MSHPRPSRQLFVSARDLNSPFGSVYDKDTGTVRNFYCTVVSPSRQSFRDITDLLQIDYLVVGHAVLSLSLQVSSIPVQHNPFRVVFATLPRSLASYSRLEPFVCFFNSSLASLLVLLARLYSHTRWLPVPPLFPSLLPRQSRALSHEFSRTHFRTRSARTSISCNDSCIRYGKHRQGKYHERAVLCAASKPARTAGLGWRVNSGTRRREESFGSVSQFMSTGMRASEGSSVRLIERRGVDKAVEAGVPRRDRARNEPW